MFGNLGNGIQGILSKIQSKTTLTQEDLDKYLKEIRIFLLEADVSLMVVKEFISNIKKNAEGAKIYNKISPYQTIVKIVHDEIVRILDMENKKPLSSGNPAIYMFVGLQGTGKTTSVAKLGLYLQKRQQKKVMLCSLDMQRKAAYEQLEVLAKQCNIDFFAHSSNKKADQIALDAKQYAIANGYDVLILDTAGRLHTDEQLMNELLEIRSATSAHEVILVADAMMGQTALNTALEFNTKVPLSSIILSRVDADSRGGTALSVKFKLNIPIHFMGTGEKVEDLDTFDPNRIADNILGKGDVVKLVEKIQDLQDGDEAELEQKMMQGNFTIVDYQKQIAKIQKLGNIGGILSMLPGMKNVSNAIANSNIDSGAIFRKHNAIIDSMTKKERLNIKILNASRKQRISKGAGVQVSDINQLVKQFSQMQKMMKQFKGKNMMNMMNMFKGKI